MIVGWASLRGAREEDAIAGDKCEMGGMLRFLEFGELEKV